MAVVFKTFLPFHWTSSGDDDVHGEDHDDGQSGCRGDDDDDRSGAAVAEVRSGGGGAAGVRGGALEVRGGDGGAPEAVGDSGAPEAVDDGGGDDVHLHPNSGQGGFQTGDFRDVAATFWMFYFF